jgi:hypothetical protein
MGRAAAGLLLAAIAAVAPFLAQPLTGDPGATVGAVVGSIVLGGSAAAVWPWAWSAAERRHHELMAIWGEARGETTEVASWDRYVAWARADGECVVLVLIRWAARPAGPSPLSERVECRLKADDVAAAAAMESLRDQAEAMEARARREFLNSVAAADRRAVDEALQAIEATARRHQEHAEAEMHREIAREEAAERRAEAAALARALRRP